MRVKLTDKLPVGVVHLKQIFENLRTVRKMHNLVTARLVLPVPEHEARVTARHRQPVDAHAIGAGVAVADVRR